MSVGEGGCAKAPLSLQAWVEVGTGMSPHLFGGAVIFITFQHFMAPALENLLVLLENF